MLHLLPLAPVTAPSGSSCLGEGELGTGRTGSWGQLFSIIIFPLKKLFPGCEGSLCLRHGRKISLVYSRLTQRWECAVPGVLEGKEGFVPLIPKELSLQGTQVSPWEGWKGLCSRKNPGIFVLEQGICVCCLSLGRRAGEGARNREKVGNRVMAWGENGIQVVKSPPALL